MLLLEFWFIFLEFLHFPEFFLRFSFPLMLDNTRCLLVICFLNATWLIACLVIFLSHWHLNLPCQRHDVTTSFIIWLLCYCVSMSPFYQLYLSVILSSHPSVNSSTCTPLIFLHLAPWASTILTIHPPIDRSTSFIFYPAPKAIAT